MVEKCFCAYPTQRLHKTRRVAVETCNAVRSIRLTKISVRGLVFCVATDLSGHECDLAIGVASMYVSGLSATRVWVATVWTISYDAPPEASPTGP